MQRKRSAMYQLDEEKTECIAIVGMAVRVPGANSLEEFWKIIEQGKEVIYCEQGSDAKQIEKKRDYYFHADTCIKKKKEFDASFFDISSADAKRMDPQQRCFMECAWEAMENAGYIPQQYDGIIGLYAGAYANTYLYYNVLPSMHDDNFLNSIEILVLNEKDHIATQTAYRMNLTGPVVNIQSSCSSSLAAVHLACQGLLDYSCDMAIAGAATVGVSESGGYLYQDIGLLSKDGHVRPFDKDATGTIYSEGIGVVILKRLEEAIEDNDHIYALIRGSAINNDGKERIGYTAPSIKGQVQVIRRAQLIAEIEPDTISYIEAHGTGTPLGDRIELEALRQVFGNTNQVAICALGSIKANIGHTGPASGVIGLIKTALALEKQILPPSINYVHANDAIDTFSSPLYVNVFSQKWETSTGIRRAGVSSFGLGGTNVHLILENAPEVSEDDEKRKVRIIPLSAKSEKSLQQLKKIYVEYLRIHEEISLQNIEYTLMNGRGNFKYRFACVCNSYEDLLNTLSRECRHQEVNAKRQSLALFVTDQVSLSDSVIKKLYQDEIHFKVAYDNVQKVIKNLLRSEVIETRALCIAYALGKMLINWEIPFCEVIGKNRADSIAKALKEEIDLEMMVREYLGSDKTKVDDNRESLPKEFMYVIYQKQETIDDYFLFDEKDTIDTLYILVARLWMNGYLNSWNAFQKGKEGKRIPIPTYQFDRQTYWIEPKSLKLNKTKEKENLYYIRTEKEMEGYVEPSGYMEKKIAEIWEKELGIKPVGVTDGFFQLGGTSLLAAKVKDVLCDYFGIEITLKDFLESQTIQDLKTLIMSI